jgi:putative transposase
VSKGRRAHHKDLIYNAGMSNYRRATIAGGTYFFTLTLADRSSDLLVREIGRLRRVYRDVNASRPFQTVAICILPDHLHAIWTLPDDDKNFSTRWNLIKSGFSRGLPAAAVTTSKIRRREKGIWQRRFWEHAIRSDVDLAHHVDYIHFNPVKHGLVKRVCDWPCSSFHQYVERGDLPQDWGGDVGDMSSGNFGE